MESEIGIVELGSRGVDRTAISADRDGEAVERSRGAPG